MGESATILDIAVAPLLDEFFQLAQVGKCVEGAAHDLNNYIGAVLAYSELITMEDHLDVNARRMLGECTGALRKAAQLVATLTIVARPACEGVVHGDLGPLAGHIVAMRQYDMRIHKVACTFQSQGMTGPVTINQSRFAIALIHLLNNACESFVGQERRDVTVKVEGLDDAVEVKVWNSGMPIGPVDCLHIFEPGFTTKGRSRPGLGLAHARRLIEEQRGTLDYEPERGFAIRLPRA